MKIILSVLCFLILPILSFSWAGNDSDNNKVVNLMSAWNEKLNGIKNKEEISKIEVHDGRYIIKTPMISYSDDSGGDDYLGMIFLKKGDGKKFGFDGLGIKFSKTRNSKFYKNVMVTTNGNFEIELRYKQNPGDSDEINLWGKDVTLAYY